MQVKLEASIELFSKANLDNTELAAKAIKASPVSIIIFKVNR